MTGSSAQSEGSDEERSNTVSMQQSQNQQQQWQQQNQQRARNKTVFSFTADTPDPQQFSEITQRLQNEPGVREISLLREGATPRIRVKVSPESISTVQQVLTQVLQSLQQTYAGTGSYSG